MAQRNLYEALGVPRTATEAEIRKAYRKVARDNHPDRNPGDTAAEERFKEASYAKEVLLNSDKRGLYDEFGEIGLREGFNAEAYRRYNAARTRQGGFPGGASGEVNLEDLIESMRAQQRRPGAPGGGPGGAGGNWGGSFQDFMNGDVVDSIFGRSRDRKAKRDLVSSIRVSFLEALKGTEKEISFKVPGGDERVLRARIPAGVSDGGRVRLKGQGADGGDLVLTVQVAPHPYFDRDGRDLLLTLPITIGEAYNGAKVPVPTPEGEVQLTIPAGVQSGSKLRLRGRGVRRGDAVGDLIATIQVRLPERGNPRAGELIEELEQAYERGPRSDLHL